MSCASGEQHWPYWPSWGHLGPSWAIMGHLGVILGPTWGFLGPSSGHLGAHLTLQWALKPRKIRCVRHVGRKAEVSVLLSLVLCCSGAALATLANLGPSWGHLGAILNNLGAILRPSWGHPGATLRRTKLHCGSQNLVNYDVFGTSLEKLRFRCCCC